MGEGDLTLKRTMRRETPEQGSEIDTGFGTAKQCGSNLAALSMKPSLGARMVR